MIVIKFGGTSVQNAEAISRAVEIVRGRLERHPIVVVSALAGATNALLGMAEQAGKGQLIGAMRAVENLRDRHLEEAESLLGSEGGEAYDELCTDLSAMFDDLANLIGALAVLGDVTPRSYDAIAAIGELASSQLVAAAMKARGIDAELVDARDVMITDGKFMAAEPDQDRIADEARSIVLPLVRANRVPVMGGFIGRNAQGITTTLGRGGGDYSAALLGAALRADAIEIWTDVDGMLTADPRVVTGARLLERVRFDEASELASFGAKVLHPATIAPAVKLGIPVWIFNSRNPAGTGTMITFEAPQRAVTAIAGKGGVTVLKVRSGRMLLAHGFLKTVFDLFAKHGVSVDVVATSEVSISVTIDDPSKLEHLVPELSQLGDVSVERNRGIIAIVGAGLADDSAAMGRALAALAGLRMHMISLSATGINLTIIVDGDCVPDAMRRLHEAFFGGAAA